MQETIEFEQTQTVEEQQNSETWSETLRAPTPTGNLLGWGRAIAVPMALGLILLLGAIFRFTGINWDDLQHLHPDERFLTMVETGIRLPGDPALIQEAREHPETLPKGCKEWGGYFDTQCSPLNPYNRGQGNFVYGTLPLFLVKFAGELLNQGGYDEIHLVGRYISGLFDLFSVLLIFFIGRRLYGTAAGLLASLFLAASVLEIQQSHFFTMDTFANVPLLLAFWCALDVADGRGLRSFIFAGLFFGLALAVRINILPFAGVIALAGILRLLQSGGARIAVTPAHTYSSTAESLSDSAEEILVRPHRSINRSVSIGPISLELEARRSQRIEGEQRAAESSDLLADLPGLLLGFSLTALGAFIAFRIAQPYAFNGIGFNPKFLADISYARDLIGGQLDQPPMHQWTARADYWFPFESIIHWGLGPGFGIAACLGLAVAGIELVRRRLWKHLLAFFWVTGLFLYLGQQVAKTDRYFLPIYPFLALFGSYFLIWLWNRARTLNLSKFFALTARVLAGGAALAAIGYTVVYAAAFTSIYTRPVTRVDASRWIFTNVPQGQALGNEHWDDPIPLRVDGKDAYGGMYRGVELQWYAEDTPEKRGQAIGWLDSVDYINLTSNRLYLSIPRLPLRYPMTTKYYEWLFDGKLGFRLVKTFTSHPSFLGIDFNDDKAEETFTVYDHPKVLIFQKTPQYSHENTAALLNSVDLSKIIRQKPLDATLSHDAFQLSASDRVDDYAGGTWSDIFNPGDLVNRIPVVIWIVLLELLGLLTLPLASVMFRGFADRGYAFTKALGVLIIGWAAWILASYHLLPFSRESILLVLVGLIALSTSVLLARRWQLVTWARQNWKLVLVQDILFLGFFFVSLLIRYGNPDLWHPAFGGEKPMDLTYLNAVIKTTWFPAYNPWFEGGYINYYYFGQIISATLVRLTGIVPEVSYNLLLPMFFGLTASAAFGVAFNLVHAIQRHESSGEQADSQINRFRPYAAGLLAAFFILIIGNLGEVGVLANALMKMGQPYRNNFPGVSGLFSLVTGGFAWLLQRKPFPIAIGDWYWSATRVIPETINEFPFFTFLYADLHAHLMALPYTLVALGIAIHAIVVRARLRWFDLLLAALVLGALRATNTWDYPVYMMIISAAMVFGYLSSEQPKDPEIIDKRVGLEQYLLSAVIGLIQVSLLVIPTNAAGIKVTLDVISYIMVLFAGLVLGWRIIGRQFGPVQFVNAVGWRIIALVGLAVVLYFPFLSTSTYGSGTAYGGVELWQGLKTNLPEYLVVHGIFLFILTTYLIADLFRQRAASDRENPGFWQMDLALLAVPTLVVLEIGLVFFNFRVLAVVLPLAVLAAWLVLRKESTPERRFIALIILAGLLMTVMVEFVTLKGDIGRMNTVFKFYLQAWVLFAVAGAVGLPLIFERLALSQVARRSVLAPELQSDRAPEGPASEQRMVTTSRRFGWKPLWWGVFALLIGIGLLYPMFATWAKVNDRYVQSSASGLDGINYMLGATYGENGHDFELAPDHEAILWLRENVEGSPVIAEANTGLYHWGNRISINTGLPTVIGWDWHTKQQYSLVDGAIIDHRIDELRTFYESTDSSQALTIMRRYSVSYIYVGPLERAVYNSVGLAKFEAMANGGILKQVYNASGVQIYQLNSQLTKLAR